MTVVEFVIDMTPGYVYVSGDIVTGRVVLVICDHEETKEIVVRFFGEASTHFEIIDEVDSANSHCYSAHESLFNMPIVLFGYGNDMQKIPAGRYIYPFSFAIPSKPLPATCNMEDCSIQYGIEAVLVKHMNCAGNSTDPKTPIFPIDIFTPVDLNTFPEASNPVVLCETKTFCCWCCATKPVMITTHTAKYGYCLGDSVPITVQIDNTRNAPILNITAALIQKWTITGKDNGRKHTKVLPISLGAAGREGIAAGESTTLEFSFVIPQDAPVSTEGCEIIKLEYGIQIDAAIKELGRDGSYNFIVFHGILVGNVALYPGKSEKSFQTMSSLISTNDTFSVEESVQTVLLV